jgi:two-component system, cell cycle sensor histidine kinase and response regulator CckA
MRGARHYALGEGGGCLTNLNVSSWRLSGLSHRAWQIGLALSIATLAAGTAGFMIEEPRNQDLPQAVAYIVVPLATLVLVAAGRGRRPFPILAASILIDVEAILLGGGPLVGLPFVVAVPLVGVAAAVRVLPPSRLLPPYVFAWFASSLGVTIAVLRAVDLLQPSALIVIPCFSVVDALALALLWRLDTSRLAAMNALAEAEARAHDLLENVDLVGVQVRADSTVDFMNEFALRLTGWTRDEVLGRNWWDTFATPDRREAARSNYADVVAGHAVYPRRRESLILTRSGERRLIRWSHVARHDAQGRFAGLASLGEDITTARAAEEEIRRGAELLSKVVVSSPLATMVLGLDRTVQLWNPAVADLLGWREDEVIGRQMPPVFLSRDRWSIARVFVRAVNGAPLDHQLLELRRRDGAAVMVRLYGGPVRDLDGKAIAVAIQAVDVTQTLAMEEQLREAQKMEAVGRLAGGVAHDFNNSLTAIGGFASLIATGSKEADSRESAETILAATKRAADLTRELLAYSRRSLLQPQTIDVNALVGAVRPMLLRLLGEDVSVVIESRVSTAMVRVDPGGLERVILNLAANARDAMPGGGRLTIATDRHEGRSTDGRAGDWVAISVSDTGEGIPPELQSQVFDPFFTTKPVGSGTGLGLAMVKGFVVQSGGHVNLVSKPGGTTVEILLPETADTLMPAPEQAGQDAMGRGETILVVEDDPTVAVMSFQVLSRRGYRVLLADTGESATALMRGHAGPIALLLVDVILPDMRGPLLVERARAAHPEASVLFASGYSAEAIGRAGELPEDVDLIEKPFAPEELLARVRVAIDRSESNERRPVAAESGRGGPTRPA